MTNFEKIKAMSVEDIACFVEEINRYGLKMACRGFLAFCDICEAYKDHGCINCVQDWLESEVEPNGND